MLLVALLAAALVAAGLPAQPVGAAEADRYVALGDSYTAGVGISPLLEQTATDVACRRSQGGWPLRVAAARSAIVDFRACAGAEIADVASRPQKINGAVNSPQIQGLDDSVDVVTVTVGGNDAGFVEVLRHCAGVFGNCWDSEFTRDQNGRAVSVGEWVDLRLQLLERDLTGLYERLRTAAPQARILAVSYPQLFADSGQRSPCPDWLFFNASERSDLNDAALALEQVIGRAAARGGVEFVAVAEHFDGREVCGQPAAADEWITGIDFTWAIWDRLAADEPSFHPSARGAEAYAQLVTTRLAAPAQIAPPPTAAAAALSLREQMLARPMPVRPLAVEPAAAACGDVAVPGQRLHLHGGDFAPRSAVEVIVQGPETPAVTVATLVASRDGQIETHVAVPLSARGPGLSIEASGVTAAGDVRRLLGLLPLAPACPAAA